MTFLLIIGAVILVALAAYFAARLLRAPVPVATQAEIEARELDEGMIVGDPVPIGSADDVGVVTVVPTGASPFTDADDFDESTGPVEPVKPGDSARASAKAASAGVTASNATQTGSPKRSGAAERPTTATDQAEDASAAGSAANTTSDRNVAGANGRNATAGGAAGRGGASADAAGGTAPATTGTAPRRHDIRWARRFEPEDESFDDATRLNLLNDLGIVRAPWGVPLLAQAYEEEPNVEHRRAALRSLAAYRHPDTQGTFDVALHSDDEEERTIAEHALTALQIRAALTP